ncbi:NAD-dependent epimerase/dehydratase family protein [Myxococcota bacterium]|nr:NAD-dependent epimerase/dehydratase family protein [Myxococcota bacterium]MBU1430750.1 NAD-dependent epimerase/dehydratase family protein [Myxococcota bacterium]MBU1897152.1 NAD-dependent epimerase/dehydratase family protein [Myxococcota bacterium]
MRALVTGGSGFIGAGLVRVLLDEGHEVRVLDDHSRGQPERLGAMIDRVELIQGDVRDARAVREAAEGCDILWHLAYVNGTRFFYEKPDVVLEVGVKGALNTVEAALDAGVKRYVLASTSETYNQPTHIPTSERERLMIPDITNPRFSYGGGKIASELLALHLGGHRGLEVVIFRPHNIYGPQMGFEHVIPEIVERIIDLSAGLTRREIELPIQGDGSETRAFCYIDDGARGAYLAGQHGEAGHIYHLGREEETSIRDLILEIGRALDIELRLIPGPLRAGGTSRRCPDITKLRALGYDPQVTLQEGVARSARWYAQRFMSRRDAR